MTDIEKCLGNLSVLNRLNDYSIWLGFFIGIFLCLFIYLVIDHVMTKRISKKEI
ncbi:hypothetical protein ACINIS251_1911 [Acinetobacter baumannii IS-251]|nr:hypothetical protein ACINIS251_1911 [Acinetobacter baumannii IS-251]